MLERKKDYHAWLYMGIPLLLLIIFTFYPIFKTAIISFDQSYDASIDRIHFNLNFYNFQRLFQHPSFIPVLQNTLLIVFITVPISTIIALLIAVGLNSIKPFQKFFQTIFFMPYVTNTIAIGMVFAVLFSFNAAPSGETISNGIINYIFGLNKDWVGVGADPIAKRFVLHSYIIWNALPFKILIFIGGLQNIGKQYYDAARIDATPKWRVLWRITIPLLSPIISYVLITSFIGSFKSYEAVIGVFNGTWAETRDMQTVVGFVYHMIEDASTYQIGAAASMVLFAIILIFTLVNLYVSKKRVHY